MKLAIVGSRNLHVKEIGVHVPECVSEVVSGGAVGIDSEAAAWANENGIKLTLFLPDYHLFGRAAPLKRNEQIADYADEVLVFWDGVSRGTENVINCFVRRGKAVHLIKVIAEN